MADRARTFGFVAVRIPSDNQDTEWLDMASYAPLRELVEPKVAALRAKIPAWDNANPVVRIARVIVEEID